MPHLVEPPRLLTEFGDQRVLVVAPHMDDEVIGCGGTVALHVAAGSAVTAVFLTDGAGNRAETHEPTIRHDEARAVAAFMGMSEPVFIDGPDTALKPRDDIVSALRLEFERCRPDVVYVPWFGDVHPDHFAANAVVWHAAQGLAVDESSVVRCYEVWSPLEATVAVDISSTMNKKLIAMQMYRSQFIAHDPAPILGLNRYRSMSIPGQAAHVECFAEFTWRRYLDLVRPT